MSTAGADVKKRDSSRDRERKVYMSDPLWRDLKILAAERDVTASALCREAVIDLLKKYRRR